MNQNKKAGLRFGVKGSTRGRLGFRNVRENLYKVMGFSPWSESDLRHFLGNGVDLSPVRPFAVVRNGVEVFPLGIIRRTFGIRGPRLAELFSSPLWVDEFPNLVVTVGLNDSLDKHLKGSAYTAAFYVGLTDGTPTPAAGDTMASHAGWTEVTAYSESVRETYTLGTVSAGSVDNSASPASFSINAGSTTIGGAFVTTVNTKGGSTGTLYGVGAFTGGDRVQGSGDTVNVTVTSTAAAA